MAYTFDGINQRIIVSAGTLTIDLIDLHSRWKDWVSAGNAGYARALDTVGGDIPDIPLYLFLLNGWRITLPAGDYDLTVTGGILVVDGGGRPFIFSGVMVILDQPVIAIGYSSDGSGLTAESIASATIAALQATEIPVNVESVNGQPIKGSGTETDPWNPA